MKKLYTSPEAEVMEFDAKDVIVTSPTFDTNPDNGAGYIWTDDTY